MPGNWENKILDHEVTPPESVWNSIAQKLDAEEQGTVPAAVKKIKEYEVTPPFAAWDSITTQLDNEEGLKIIVPARNRKALYWAVAAASVALIIVSVTWYKNTTSKNTLPVAKTTVPANEKDTISSISSQKNLIAVNDSAVIKSTIPIPRDNKQREDLAAIEPINQVETGYVKAAEVTPFTNNPFDNNKEKLANSNGEYAINTDLVNSPDRYVIITGPNGSLKRVSVKLSAYIGYLNDEPSETEEPLDKIIRESSLWKGKFKAWSNKLIDTDLSPGMSNFMDLFELSKLLSEK
jgi:hypothetical protein